MIVHLIRTSADRSALCGVALAPNSERSIWLRRVTCARCLALADGHALAPVSNWARRMLCSRCGVTLADVRRAHVCPHGKRCVAKRWRPHWHPVCTLCLFEYALNRSAVDGDD